MPSSKAVAKGPGKPTGLLNSVERVPEDLWERLPEHVVERFPLQRGEAFDLDVVIGQLYGARDDDGFTEYPVLMNDGDGVMELREEAFPTASYPIQTGVVRDLVLADVDGDGDLDLIVGAYVYPSHVLINDGTGSFTETRQLDVLPTYTNALAVGDLNGDGAVDVVTANRGENHVLLNDGSGNFAYDPEATIGYVDQDGGNAISVALGDFNGDGHLDAVVGTLDAGVYLATNDGAANFAPAVQIAGVPNIQAIAAGDLDGDGDLDLLLGNDGGRLSTTSPDNAVLFNDGTGNFEGAFLIGETVTVFGEERYFADAGRERTLDIALGDLDGDGDLDAVVANVGMNQVMFNDGAGNFETFYLTQDGLLVSEPSEAEIAAASLRTTDVLLADMDSDGDLDILFSHNDSSMGDQLLLNEDAESFTVQQIAGTEGNTAGLAVGDLDGDGGAATVNEYGLAHVGPADLLPDLIPDSFV